MTPEERDLHFEIMSSFAAWCAEQIRAAIAEEREACWKIAVVQLDKTIDINNLEKTGGFSMASKIAKAIRARGGESG